MDKTESFEFEELEDDPNDTDDLFFGRRDRLLHCTLQFAAWEQNHWWRILMIYHAMNLIFTALVVALT